jgi:hypothetical protein
MSNSLFTDEIFKRIKSDKFAKSNFLGVFPRDLLPQVKKVPCSAVINTDSSREPGQHWIAFYVDEKRVCTFFDSYGRRPSEFNLDSYFQSFSLEIKYNDQQIQSVKSSSCGHFCIFFILLKSRCYELEDMFQVLSKKKLFSK